jgi:phage shock protein PspC (stress-responsive transcriptional regulator)
MAASACARQAEGMTTTQAHPETNHTARRQLCRPADDRMLTGVASGIARYVDVEPVLVRIAFVLLTLVGGLGVPIYLACWLLIPAEGQAASIAGEFAGTVRDWQN